MENTKTMFSILEQHEELVALNREIKVLNREMKEIMEEIKTIASRISLNISAVVEEKEEEEHCINLGDFFEIFS